MPTIEAKTDMTPKGVVATGNTPTGKPAVEQKPGQTVNPPGRIEPAKENKPEAGKGSPSEHKPAEMKHEVKAV